MQSGRIELLCESIESSPQYTFPTDITRFGLLARIISRFLVIELLQHRTLALTRTRLD